MALCAAVLLLSVYIPMPLVDGKVKCYDCIAPLNANYWSNYCDLKKYCEGEYCTKGRNARSNGLLYGCSSTPPVHNTMTKECQIAESAIGPFQNCYCKNNNYCNSSSVATWFLTLIFMYMFM